MWLNYAHQTSQVFQEVLNLGAGRKRCIEGWRLPRNNILHEANKLVILERLNSHTHYTLMKMVSLQIVVMWLILEESINPYYWKKSEHLSIFLDTFLNQRMKKIKFRNLIQDFLQLLGKMSVKLGKIFTLRSQFLVKIINFSGRKKLCIC